ncbi:MAG TPA: hypothetical protein VD836_04670 [Solirubrobacteraceae bacterium]|nr:hypothetical protein [Solirubrobacteraceae bacterium]
MRRPVLLCVLFAIALAAPAAARADVLYEYERLAERDLEPAPLVFTRVPGVLRPVDRYLEPLPSRRRTGYGLRLYDDSAGAVIALEAGSFEGMRGALREAGRLGLRAVPVRVRGHRGRLLTRPRTRVLLWREGGVVYWLGTGTADVVPVRALKRTANALERLGGAFSGTGGDPDLGTGATLVTTEGTVSAFVEWAAHCVAADGFERSDRAGSLAFTLLPLDGGTFRAAIAARGWTGTVEGTVGANAVDVTVHATTTVDGATCDTGRVTFRIEPTGPR